MKKRALKKKKAWFFSIYSAVFALKTRRNIAKIFDRDRQRVFIAAGFSVAILALGLYGAFSPEYAKARMSTFFPTTCLGGWDSPENAEGEPKVTDGDIKKFNVENSAVLRNKVSTIFCGKFDGEIPQYASSTRVSLKLSWATKPLSIPESVLPETVTNSVFEETPSVASSTVATTTTPEIVPEIATTTEQAEPAVATTTEEMEPTVATSTVPEISTSTNNGLEANIIQSITASSTETVIPVIVPIPEEVVAPSSEPATTTEPVSLLEKAKEFFAFATPAHAQETEVTVTDITSTTSIPVANELFIIKYTLDGTTWTKLATITTANFYKESFDIPAEVLARIADIKKLQIAIESKPWSDAEQDVYLDGMSVEIEYETIKTDETVDRDAFSSSKNLPDFSKEQVLDVKGMNDGSVVILTSSVIEPVVLEVEEVASTTSTTTEDVEYSVTSTTDNETLSPLGTSSETVNSIWIVDKGNKVKIYRDALSPADNFPLGLYGGYIIWLSNKKGFVNVYNIEKGLWYQKKIPEFSPSNGERGVVAFKGVPWKVIVGHKEFYFEVSNAGEIFSENNAEAIQTFRLRVSLDNYLDEVELSSLSLD